MDTVDIFDPNYVQKQQVANLRRMAAEQNTLRVQTYQGQCRTWVEVNLRNRDLGVPVSALPVIPKKIVVDDDGEWRETAFDDLQPPVLPPPSAEVRRADIKASSASLPPDRLDQALGCLQVLNSKLDRLLAR